MGLSGFSGTYTLSSSSFVVTSDGNNIQWEGSSNIFLAGFVSTTPENAGTTNNASIPLRRVFVFNNVGSPSKSWPIHSSDSALTRLTFTSNNNNGWVGTWNDRDGAQFTIQEPVSGTFTLTRNGNTHNCSFIDQTNLTNVMLSYFDSASQPCVVVRTANSGISIIKNAANGEWIYSQYDKTS